MGWPGLPEVSGAQIVNSMYEAGFRNGILIGMLVMGACVIAVVCFAALLGPVRGGRRS